MKKRGQAWGFDLMIASTLFFLALIIFFTYSINYPKESQETLDKLTYDGNFLAETLLSEGNPANWNPQNYQKIGLTSNKKINQTKLEYFYEIGNENLNPQNYEQTKSSFSTQYEYFVNFSEIIYIGAVPISEGGIGKSFQNEEVENLIKVTRFAVYQDNPVTINIYIWE